MSLTFNEYQTEAKKTAIYPSVIVLRKENTIDTLSKEFKLAYPVMGLVGEAGEIANKVKKILRDDDGIITDEKRFKIAGELGDVLWYVSAIASDLDLRLDSIAFDNIQKLRSRQKAGKIIGDGNNR